MPASVTYTFTASTPARASEVNQNFTDLVNYMNTGLMLADGSVAFTGIPSLPASDPTSDNQAARKAYVDAQLSSFPAGIILPYGGASAPSGYLLCYGQAISRTTYAALYTAIATSYGVGNGSTTFNVPDLRGRVPVGIDNMGGSDAGILDIANTLGLTGGEQKHTMTTSELVTHTHVQDAHTHTPNDGAQFRTDDSASANTIQSVGSGGLDNGRASATTEATATNQNTGSSTPFNVMQPYQIFSYIIKT